jgi:hypothetical protein
MGYIIISDAPCEIIIPRLSVKQLYTTNEREGSDIIQDNFSDRSKTLIKYLIKRHLLGELTRKKHVFNHLYISSEQINCIHLSYVNPKKKKNEDTI